jgi:hypothetical protein
MARTDLCTCVLFLDPAAIFCGWCGGKNPDFTREAFEAWYNKSYDPQKQAADCLAGHPEFICLKTDFPSLADGINFCETCGEKVT